MDWMKTIQELQVIGQTGLGFAKDQYDRQRFTAVLDVASRILASVAQIDRTTSQSIILEDKGYRTPKVDVRGAIFRGDKILLVREKDDGKWTLPGGWADINESPKTGVEREILEETGLIARVSKLAAVHDINHHQPEQLYHTYKMFFICAEISGNLTDTEETDGAKFYRIDEIPELSTRRVTRNQIELCFKHQSQPQLPTEVD